jgi:hypothetical protein
MPEVPLEYIPRAKAAELEGITDFALAKRLQRGKVALMNDPEDGRRKLVPVSILSPNAHAALRLERTRGALEKLGARPGDALARQRPDSLQPPLPFDQATPAEQRLLDAAPVGIPQQHAAYVARLSAIVGENRNGTWKRYQGETIEGITIRCAGDYLKVLARQNGVGVSTLRDKIAIHKGVYSDPAVPPEEKEAEFWRRVLPKNRPGRSGHDFFSDPENAWMAPWAEGRYLSQSRPSVIAVHNDLLAEIEAKQRAWRVGHLYQRPTIHQTRALLKRIERPRLVLGREGSKAFNDKCAPYISRTYEGLRSNEIWVTDQRLVNVRLRGWGEKLGRIWVVNFLDVASMKWLGFWVAPRLSSEIVMMAAAMALERAGVPHAVHVDLGKEFLAREFSGNAQAVSRAVLYREAEGLWERLGVKLIKAIGRNPQTKTIERWHGCVDDFDRNFPGYCGRNTDERPEELKDQEAQHAAWLAGDAPATPLVTARHYVQAFAAWCENEWNAKHRGRGKILHGLTPNEAFNTKRPEGGLRKLSRAEIDYQTAERRRLKVARGGQVNVTFYGETIEYAAPELFWIVGQDVEVIRSRRTLRQVTVIYPVPGGTRDCVARTKRQFHWQSKDPAERERLKEAIRAKRLCLKAVKRGTEARAELQSPPAPMLPEISSSEFMAERFNRRVRRHFPPAPPRKTTEDLAKEFMEDDRAQG